MFSALMTASGLRSAFTININIIIIIIIMIIIISSSSIIVNHIIISSSDSISSKLVVSLVLLEGVLGVDDGLRRQINNNINITK